MWSANCHLYYLDNFSHMTSKTMNLGYCSSLFIGNVVALQWLVHSTENIVSLRKLYAFSCSGIWIVFVGGPVKLVIALRYYCLPTLPTPISFSTLFYVSDIITTSRIRVSGYSSRAFSHSSATKFQGKRYFMFLSLYHILLEQMNDAHMPFGL